MEKFRRTLDIEGLQNASNSVSVILQEESKKRNKLIFVDHVEYGEKKHKKLLMEFEKETDCTKGVNNFVVQKSCKRNPGKKPEELAKPIVEKSGHDFVGAVESSNGRYFLLFFA